jgi:hypothetical protein
VTARESSGKDASDERPKAATLRAPSGPQPARLHGACGLCDAAAFATDGERQARPQSATGAGPELEYRRPPRTHDALETVITIEANAHERAESHYVKVLQIPGVRWRARDQFSPAIQKPSFSHVHSLSDVP